MSKRLRAQQAALVDAVATGGVAPAGLDAARVAITRTALARKRASELARLLPATERALGPGFAARLSHFLCELPRAGDKPLEALALARSLPPEQLDEISAREIVALAIRAGGKRFARQRFGARGMILGLRLPGLPPVFVRMRR